MARKPYPDPVPLPAFFPSAADKPTSPTPETHSTQLNDHRVIRSKQSRAGTVAARTTDRLPRRTYAQNVGVARRSPMDALSAVGRRALFCLHFVVASYPTDITGGATMIEAA